MNEAINTVLFFLLGLFCIWFALVVLNLGPDALSDRVPPESSWWERFKTSELEHQIGWFVSVALFAAMGIGFFQAAFR